MEPPKASFDYSLKCIPIPTRDTHIRGVIHKTEQFLQRVRWKVFFFFNPPKDNKQVKETYGFNTPRNAPQNKALVGFEDDLTHLISNLVYDNMKTPFQRQLIKDSKDIQKSDKVFVTADKTRNVYKLDTQTYNKLMRDNVTSHYVKTTVKTEDEINSKAKNITERLEISDRIEPIAHKNAYITIKDHKEDFPNSIKCRLINPAKSNVGKISQQLLQKINEEIRCELKLNQWRSTTDTLNWFKDIKQKTRLKFIQLDIVGFYPSITEGLFNSAINFAAEICPISTQTKEILYNARQSILFHDDTVWKKTTGLFDVTMGSYDGCELCELVGLYIIHCMNKRFPEIDFGLYRDDGLGTIKRTPKRKQEQMKKGIHAMFKEIGLSITCDTDLTVVNFLDVTLDLHGDIYKPYRKPNDNPVYIHKESNHPPHVAKQLPISVNKRLNTISCDKTSFDNFKGDYEKALCKSGLYSKLTFEPKRHNIESSRTKKQRKRNVIWFTPPYCASLKTNLGKEFLKLIDKNFPINNPLHAILNRKTVKMSYSCTENMQTLMQNHNRKVLNKNENKQQKVSRCSCRNAVNCPVPGECATENVIYQATVTHDNKTAEYIGSTAPDFKLRYGNHTKSFKFDKYKNDTTLSAYVWDNALNPNPTIKWKFLRKCKQYAPGQKACDLCLSEKHFILTSLHQTNNLNKRTDLGNKCPHKKWYTLAECVT